MNETTLPQVLDSNSRIDISITREPAQVLAEAQKAAVALQNVISKKHKPVIFNGEQYLEFEDWQTVGRFYGITAKVQETRAVELGNVTGFEARAVAYLISTGEEISAADAMCMNDERNWKDKPLFQLRSMAQTRACAKALRNVLAWVVVLAGYKPTPAEEVEGEIVTKTVNPPQSKSAPKASVHSETPNDKLQMIDLVEVKEGQKNGKAWKKYSVKIGRDYYSTFSETDGEAAVKAYQKQWPVVIDYKEEGQYKNLTAIQVIEQPEKQAEPTPF